MSIFGIVCVVATSMIFVALFLGLVLAVRSRDDATRVVLADMVFYCMIGIYMVWSLGHTSSITYDIALLASLLGALTTVSMARILSQGRR